MEYNNERPEAFDTIAIMEQRGKKYIRSFIRYIIFDICMLIFVITSYINSLKLYFIIGYSILFIGATVLYRYNDLKFIRVYLKNKKIIYKYKNYYYKLDN